MKKTVGNIMVEIPQNIDRNSKILVINNTSFSKYIHLNGIEDIEDLEYILQGLKFKIKRRDG